MMGRQHALSGVAVGLLLAPLVGLDQAATVALFAGTVGGWALAPDLDCGGATASRSLGVLTRGLSWCLRHLSETVYHHTLGPADQPGRSGEHRCLTHTLAFALTAGLLAGLSSLASPWVVAGWAGFGLLCATRSLGGWVLLLAGAGMAAPLVTSGPAALAALDGAPLGIAVAAGCVAHLAADGVTCSGIPALWPVRIGGQRWHELHLLPAGFRLHTGQRVERWLVFPAFVAATIAAALLTMPGISDLLAGLDWHALTTAT